MRNDLENGTVTVQTLQIARDHESVLRNLAERDDPFQMREKADQITKLRDDQLQDIDGFFTKQK